MKLHILGTGNGVALKCYNTCSVIENNGKYLLVDGGGGNQILKQLESKNIELSKIHDIFLSHIHTDHIMGLVWIVRMITQKMLFENSYEGNLNIYGGSESMKTLQRLMEMLFAPTRDYIGKRIFFNTVVDGEIKEIIDSKIEFLDLRAKKAQQFGFKINDEIVFSGDETLSKDLFDKVKDSKWLLHEAFCLEKDEEKFQAHIKGHGTVKDISEIASNLNIKNLVLWHTEESNLAERSARFSSEASINFKGNIYVPNDLDTIILD